MPILCYWAHVYPRSLFISLYLSRVCVEVTVSSCGLQTPEIARRLRDQRCAHPKSVKSRPSPSRGAGRGCRPTLAPVVGLWNLRTPSFLGNLGETELDKHFYTSYRKTLMYSGKLDRLKKKKITEFSREEPSARFLPVDLARRLGAFPGCRKLRTFSRLLRSSERCRPHSQSEPSLSASPR